MTTYTRRVHRMHLDCVLRRARITGGMLVAAGMVAAAACSGVPTVPDLNNASVSGFATNPTITGANALVIGIIRGVRDNAMNETQVLGQIAREGYGICQSCNALSYDLILPMNSTTYPVTQIYPVQYTDLREAQIVLSALPKIPGI